MKISNILLSAAIVLSSTCGFSASVTKKNYDELSGNDDVVVDVDLSGISGGADTNAVNDLIVEYDRTNLTGRIDRKRDKTDLNVYRKVNDCWTWTNWNNPEEPLAREAPDDFLALANSPGSDPIFFRNGAWWGAVQFWPNGKVKYSQSDIPPAGTGEYSTTLNFAMFAYDETGTNVLYRFGATATRTDPTNETLVAWNEDRNGYVRIATTDNVTREIASATNGLRKVDGSARPLPKYLHALDFADSYPEAAAEYYRSRGNGKADGGCSSVRDGNTYSRNFDFPFDDRAEFVVRVSAGTQTLTANNQQLTTRRFASVGVAQVGTNLTEEIVTSGKPSKWYKSLPGATVDGINENGVVVNINVVDGDPQTSGWHTTGDLHPLAAVRWVLDNATNAVHGAEYIAANIRFPQGWTQNYHYMIADETATYIVENGTAYPILGRPVMTNFRIAVEPPYGPGVERYNLLMNPANSITNAWFTNAYRRETNPPWVSDLHDVLAYTNDIFNAWASHPKEYFRNKTNNGQPWWQTIHTSVYDISNRVLRVAVQEVNDWYTFQVPSAGGVKPDAVREIVQPMIEGAANAATNYTDAAITSATNGLRRIDDDNVYAQAFTPWTYTISDPRYDWLTYEIRWYDTMPEDWEIVEPDPGWWVWYEEDFVWIAPSEHSGGAFKDRNAVRLVNRGYCWNEEIEDFDYFDVIFTRTALGIAPNGDRYAKMSAVSQQVETVEQQLDGKIGTSGTFQLRDDFALNNLNEDDIIWFDGDVWCFGGNADWAYNAGYTDSAGVAEHAITAESAEFATGADYAGWADQARQDFNGEDIIETYRRKDEYLPLASVTNVNGITLVDLKDFPEIIHGGVEWTQCETTESRWYAVAFDSGRFFAGSGHSSGKGIIWSDDGITWNSTSMTSGRFFTICSNGDGGFVAGGVVSGIFFSTNGIDWIQSSATNGNWRCSAYGKGRFIAGSGDTAGIWYSDDGGVTWTQGGFEGDGLYAVAYGGGRFVAARKTADTGLYYSDDGVTWTQSSKTTGDFRSLCYGEGRFIAGGHFNGIWYSDDGINWVQSIKTSGNWSSVCYGNGRFIAGGTGLWYSDDRGVNWTRSAMTTYVWYGIAYGNGRFVAASSPANGYLWRSDDTITRTVPVIQQIKVNGVLARADNNNVVNIELELPGNYASVSNAAMTAHRDATNYTDDVVSSATNGVAYQLTTEPIPADLADKVTYIRAETHEGETRNEDENGAVVIGKGAVGTPSEEYIRSLTNATGKTVLRSASVAIGANAIARSADGKKGQSIAIGWNSKATGGNAIAIGSGAVHWFETDETGPGAFASGVTSLAVGYDAKATASTANAIGSYAKAKAVEATQIGRGENTIANSLKFQNVFVVKDGKVQGGGADTNTVREIVTDELDPALIRDLVEEVTVKSHAITTFSPTNGTPEEIYVTPTGSRNYEVYLPNTAELRGGLPIQINTEIEGEVTRLGPWWTNRIVRLPAKIALKEPVERTLIAEVEQYDTGWDWTSVVTRAAETNGSVTVEGTNLHFTASVRFGSAYIRVTNPRYFTVSVNTNGVHGASGALVGGDGSTLATFTVE